MDRATIIQRMKSISKDMNRMTAKLDSLAATDTGFEPTEYEEGIIGIAHRSEVITCRLRNLVILSLAPDRYSFFNDSADAMEIRIEDSGGVIEARFPCLLPKKKKWADCSFLVEPFEAAMHTFAKEHPQRHFQNCVICFSHIYDRALPERRIRDYDNIEMKNLLDIITAYLLEDDGGLVCDAYHTTKLGDSDCTIVSIMARDRFPRWLEEHR